MSEPLEWTERADGEWVATRGPVTAITWRGVGGGWWLEFVSETEVFRVPKSTHVNREAAYQTAEVLVPQIVAAVEAIRYVALRQAVERGEAPRVTLVAASTERELQQAEALTRLATTAAERMRERAAQACEGREQAWVSTQEWSRERGGESILDQECLLSKRNEAASCATAIRALPVEEEAQ